MIVVLLRYVHRLAGRHAMQSSVAAAAALTAAVGRTGRAAASFLAGRPAGGRTEVINCLRARRSGFNSCLPVPSSTGKG